jgi:hypothetical protein
LAAFAIISLATAAPPQHVKDGGKTKIGSPTSSAKVRSRPVAEKNCT